MNPFTISQTRENSHSDSEVELTIVMPCLDEAETLATCIKKAKSFLHRTGVSGEVVIADNGSTDGSQEIARTHGARVVNVSARGYGAALLGGIKAARGRFVIMGDSDDSYDFEQLDKFVEQLRLGADLVMGNRFAGSIAKGAMPVLHRYLGNPVLSFLGRLFFRIDTGDFHCGLRGFRLTSIKRLELHTTGMEFASEMVVRSALAGLRIVDVPTTLRPDGRSRPPHLKTWRDGWRHLKFLLMYSPRWLFIIPGVCFVSAGMLLAMLLSLGPLHFQSNVVLDLNSFVSACFLIILGIQLVTFGALSRYYASITGFLPDSRRSDTLISLVTTDRLIWIAVGCLAVGGLLFAAAIAFWANVNFGPITGTRVPRMAVAGLTAMVIGLQTFFSAFFLGVLAIPVRKLKPATESEADAQ